MKTLKLIFLCLDVLVKFHNAMELFVDPILEGNYQKLYLNLFALSIHRSVGHEDCCCDFSSFWVM